VYKLRCDEARQQFEKDLEQKAAALGQELRLKYFIHFLRERDRIRERDRERERRGERGRGRILEPEDWEKPYRFAMALLPVAGVGTNLWSVGASYVVAGSPRTRGPVHDAIQRIHTDELIRQQFVEDARNHPTFFQFQYPWSDNPIAGPAGPLPLIRDDPASQNGTFPRHEYVESASGPIYRVVIKYPLSGGPFRGWWPDTSRMQAIQSVVGVAGASASPLPPFLMDRGADLFPFVYVHCGRPKAELDGQYAQHASYRDDQLRENARETQTSLTQLRVKLALIGGLTFAALAVGGWLLIGRGVAPIRKLSDAVSRVSEKDFRLPIEERDLSRELLPIHGRLTQTLDELRRAFEREKQAVADISHELKTPLAALLTSQDVSLRKPRTAEQYRATLEECRDISRQLGRLVDRIMTLASLDAGNDHTAFERVDAADVATECAIVVRPLAAAHGIALTTVIDSDAEMSTDPDKLRDVLKNLLHNAVEYNRPGGTVELRVAADRGRVTFAVRDTGIGMTPDVRGKIFERFYRADPSRTQTGVHAGLGLAIVKEYVERLGGTITVESEPGVGSTFRVTLPTGGAGKADGNGLVSRSGYTPLMLPRIRTAAGAD
jgi:signal transduction histidine kinase